nr:MAG TPA: hypothetical protein [Caudoviricetes sp.]
MVVLGVPEVNSRYHPGGTLAVWHGECYSLHTGNIKVTDVAPSQVGPPGII